MHTILIHRTENDKLGWYGTVGYYAPCELVVGVEEQRWTWKPLRDFKDKRKAFAYVNYLNGGPGHIWQWDD